MPHPDLIYHRAVKAAEAPAPPIVAATDSVRAPDCAPGVYSSRSWLTNMPAWSSSNRTGSPLIFSTASGAGDGSGL